MLLFLRKIRQKIRRNFAKKNGGKIWKKIKSKKIALIFNILQVIALAVFEVVLFRLVSYKNKLILDYVPAKYFYNLRSCSCGNNYYSFSNKKGKENINYFYGYIYINGNSVICNFNFGSGL